MNFNDLRQGTGKPMLVMQRLPARLGEVSTFTNMPAGNQKQTGVQNENAPTWRKWTVSKNIAARLISSLISSNPHSPEGGVGGDALSIKASNIITMLTNIMYSAASENPHAPNTTTSNQNTSETQIPGADATGTQTKNELAARPSVSVTPSSYAEEAEMMDTTNSSSRSLFIGNTSSSTRAQGAAAEGSVIIHVPGNLQLDSIVLTHPRDFPRPDEIGFTVEELKSDESDLAWLEAFRVLQPIGASILKAKTLIRKWPLNFQDIEEIIDDAVLRVHKNVQAVRNYKELRSFFITALLCEAKDKLKHNGATKRGTNQTVVTAKMPLEYYSENPRKLAFNSLPAADLEVLDWSQFHRIADENPTPMLEAHCSTLKKMLEEWMTKLVIKDRQLLKDRYFDSMTHEEIAAKRGKSTEQIGIELARALAKLHRLIPTNLLWELANLYGTKKRSLSE